MELHFSQFLENSSQQMEDIRKTLSKLPKKHKKLVKGYKFVFQSGNTLKNDATHIGLIDEDKKTITVAGGWNYGREYTLLHEIAHLVFKYFITEENKKEWHSILEKTKNKMKQNDEEAFCMAYANNYAANKIEIHNHNTWNKFILSIEKNEKNG